MSFATSSPGIFSAAPHNGQYSPVRIRATVAA
jgi:hypothetical protein